MATIEDVILEVKKASTSVEDLHKSTQKELHDLRAYTDQELKKIDEGTKRTQEEAWSRKQEALDQKFVELKADIDKVTTAMQRTALGAPDPDGKKAAERIEHAIQLDTQIKSVKGQLKGGTIITAKDIDLEAFDRRAKGMEMLLRYGPTQVPADCMKDLMVGQETLGGYWVQPAMSARIVARIYETSPVRRFATVETISTDSMEIPIDDGEFDSGWLGETESPQATATSEMGLQSITVHTQYAKPRATQQLLEDAAINVEGYMGNKVAERFGRQEATKFIVGTGVKQPRGFLTYPAGTGRGKLVQIVSGDNNGPTADVLKQFMYQLKEPYLANAVWMFNRLTAAKIAILREDGAIGQYLWRPGLETGAPSTLLGYPFALASDMPVPATNALIIAFGDMRQAYTIVDRLGISVIRDPYTSKPFVEFWSRRRVGGDVVQFEAMILMKQST